jgi:hypothetical protein
LTRFKVLKEVRIEIALFRVVSKVLNEVIKETAAPIFRKGEQKSLVTTYKTTGYHKAETHTYKSAM